jgi:hypothetical protein
MRYDLEAEETANDRNVIFQHFGSKYRYLWYSSVYEISIRIYCRSVAKTRRNLTVCVLCKSWKDARHSNLQSSSSNYSQTQNLGPVIGSARHKRYLMWTFLNWQVLRSFQRSKESVLLRYDSASMSNHMPTFRSYQKSERTAWYPGTMESSFPEFFRKVSRLKLSYRVYGPWQHTHTHTYWRHTILRHVYKKRVISFLHETLEVEESDFA